MRRLCLLIFLVTGLSLKAQKNLIACVSYKGKFGFISQTGKFIIKPVYSDAHNFNCGLAAVAKDSSCAFINSEDSVIIDITSKNLAYGFDFNNNLCIANHLKGADSRLGGSYGLIKSDGEYFISPDYLSVREWSEGCCAVKNMENFWGFVDSVNHFIIDPSFQNALPFSEGMAAVEKNNKWGFIYKNGSWAVQPEYDTVLCFSEGLAAAKKNGKYGFIDKYGKTQIDFRFDIVHQFNEGMAAVNIGGSEEWNTNEISLSYIAKGGMWGYINKNGALTIPIKYERTLDYHEGLASVTLDGKMGAIDVNGKISIKFKFQYLGEFVNGLAVAKNGKYGYVNKKGKWIIKPKFDVASSFSRIS